MYTFLQKIAIYGLLVLGFAFMNDSVFTSIFRKGRTVKAQWLNMMKDQHYDLAITGSSKAWWNIDMNLISQECDIRAINMANNHFTPSEVLLGLKKFIANGNTLDRLLYEVNYQGLNVEHPQFSSTIYDYLPWLEDEVVYDHLRHRSPEWPLLRHIPFARYARYNFRWGPEEALVTVLDKRNTIFDSTGSFFIDRPFSGYPYYEIGPLNYQFDEDNKEIIRLCAENGIKLEFFTAPYYRLRLPPGEKERFHSLLADTGLPYHDHSNVLDSTIHFDNSWHLSYHGGQLYTRMLVEEVICPAYPISDGRRESR